MRLESIELDDEEAVGVMGGSPARRPSPEAPLVLLLTDSDMGYESITSDDDNDHRDMYVIKLLVNFELLF